MRAINLEKNAVYHIWSKHMAVKKYYIRDVYKNGEVELKYCSLDKIVANILTKDKPPYKRQVIKRN